jgi:predicted extracellular nuclease
LSSRLARISALALVALGGSLAMPLASVPAHATSSPTPTATAESPRIHTLQGRTRVSPFNGRAVSGVPGIVTAVRASGDSRGFWIQDPRPDHDPATSEGLFVFTGKHTPEAAPGDSLRVSGDVREFYPGGRDVGGQSVTELTGARWSTSGTGLPLPRAVRLDSARVPPAYAPRADGGTTIEPLTLRPHRYALDLYESLEGMRTGLSDAPVTGPTTPYGELWVTTRPGDHPTPRGGTLYGSYAQPNGGRLKVASLLPAAERRFPEADTGDELRGTTAGPMDYDDFGGYSIQATTLGALKKGGLRRETTRKQRENELSVATYNVENLSPKTDPAKFARLAGALVHNLASPDIVGVEEVQDNSGPDDDGTVAADRTLDQLTAAIRKAGGPAYHWRQIDPQDKADGGQPGGNIRVAFLYNPRRVSFTDRAGGGTHTPVRVEKDAGGRPRLSASPGRVDPGNAAWKQSRKPLAGEFRFRGRRVFVVANHLSSKGGGDLAGDEPMEGRFQPPVRHSEPQRVEQAKVVNSFVHEIRSLDSEAAVIVMGDLNDFPFSPTLDALRSGRALTGPMRRLPPGERYGYVYNGNSQALDHILTSPGTGRVAYDIVHINSEFHDQSSDHDPSVVRLLPRHHG